MSWKQRYENAKIALAEDDTIAKANRAIFEEFFAYEEYKLKRQNRLSALDTPCYKTLYGYVPRLRNVNSWFRNKPWKDLTREDIKRVYDDLEDGLIKSKKGLPFKDLSGYYSKVLKGKPFRIAGKSELAKDVIEFCTPSSDTDVRFLTEEVFKRMVAGISNSEHLLLFWLAWDLGENIGALLQLQKKDFTRQRNRQTKETEYLVNLPREKLKRSRRPRTEPTLYAETARHAEIILVRLDAEDHLFRFGHRQALKVMHSVAKRTGATCLPNNDPVRWKDLRSGMACHLLKNGWTREEVDARLGHTPQSKALNAYINYLAIDRERPKKRLFDSSLEEIQNELEESKRREKLTAERLRRQQEEMGLLKEQIAGISVMVNETKEYTAGVSRIHQDLKRRVAQRSRAQIG